MQFLTFFAYAQAESTTASVSGVSPENMIRLGSAVQYTISSGDLKTSQSFYEKLGFKKVMETPSGIQMTDESVLIMLQPGKEKYVRISYFDTNADKIAALLEQSGVKVKVKNENTGMLTRSILETPDGIEISLVKMDAASIYKPKGKSMAAIASGDLKDISQYPNKICGVFGELSFPVKDLDKSMAFWKQFGFTGEKNQVPYPWAVLTDSLSVIGLHQQNTFNYSAITFFAPDMRSRIEKLKKDGMLIKDFTGEGNGVIDTPEGFHIFLFSL